MNNPAVASLFTAIRTYRAAMDAVCANRAYTDRSCPKLHAAQDLVMPVITQAASLGMTELEAYRAYDRAAGWPGNFQSSNVKERNDRS